MNALRLALASLVFCLLSAGCRVSTHDSGRNKNVDIGTPFGSMHVKTDTQANLSGMGITPYPGSTPYREDGKDGDAADVNMNFGSFHLGVKAAGFLSADSKDQILSFYRKDLARYGEVILCSNNEAVGEPTHTGQGLSCSDSDHSKHHSDSGLELRAGSPQHQHIVGLEPHGDGFKIGLVALDLPGRGGSRRQSEEE